MKAGFAVLIAVVIGVWVPQAWGQATQPAREQEWFVSAQRLAGRPVRHDGTILRQFVRCDFANGRQVVLQNSQWPSFPRVSLMDSHGRHLNVQPKDHGRKPQPRHIILVSPAPGTPKRVFEEWQVEPYWPAALSPDGRKIVVFQFGRAIAIGDDTNLHVIPRKWESVRPFSWSPDSRQVAFYYAPTTFEDDVHIQQHGVALLTIEGKLRELVKVSEVAGTPDGGSKDVPPGWGRSGRFVYYTVGLPPDDPQRELPGWRSPGGFPYPPSATYRVDVETGKTERIGVGAFASVAPDESYVLLYPSPELKDDGSWRTRATAKVDLATKQVTYLPDAVRRPKISPSGRLVASAYQGITCFTTKDWKPYGKPSPNPGSSVEAWARNFRWITVDEDHKPGSAW